MKKFALGLFLLMTFSAVFSQKLFFIYLQTEPEQPFFVKVNDKVHSSTSSGYLILSRLKDSVYAISAGFPQNKWPEQKFTIEMKGKDRGYLLKNYGEKGWGLYDMETKTIQMSSSDNNNSKAKTESKNVSVFTDILSKAANDPSLKEKPVTAQPAVAKDDKKLATEPGVVKKEEIPVVKKEEPPVVKKDNSQAITDQPVIKKEEPKNIPVEEYKRSVVTRKSESSTSEGLSLLFVDDYGNDKKDTIRIIIPDPKKNVPGIKDKPKEEKKFLDITAGDTLKEKTAGPELTESTAAQVSKNNCTVVATESDFLKLRKKMAAEMKDDAMVDEAKKYFRTKCFTVVQVKNISTLFLNDAGKYKFFDAAYEHVSDPDNFPSLASEIKDEYYTNRFKAMLR
ncbi:MAG: DUF4476 domain-containing protein [Bacteroidota bacterium]|nr:DUF4476 domain-containing protein [Bacteroidota bacterium]